MLKKLIDLCLKCIENNLHLLRNLQESLPTKFKEVVIERLACHDKFSPEYVSLIIQQLFSALLKKISFHECAQIDDDVLQKLSDSGCQLECLTIDGCANVSDAGLQALLQNQRELITLELIFLPRVTGSCLRRVHSPAFQHIIVQEEHCDALGLDNDALCSFIDNNRSLFFICIHKAATSRPLTESHVSRIITSIGQRLCHFYLTGNTAVSDYNLQELANKSKNLRTLKIRKLDETAWRTITEKGLQILFRGCQHISDLNLCFYHELFERNHGTCSLPYFPETLVSLTLDGSSIGMDEATFYDAFCRLPNLRKLDTNIDGISADTLDRTLAKIGHQLRDLKMAYSSSHCTIMHSVMESVVNYCINLKSWTVYTCNHMTGRELYPLLRDENRASKLTCLKLWPVGHILYDVLMTVASSCQNLETLTVCNSDVDDDMIMTLSRNCTNLKNIDLNGESASVTEEVLSQLAIHCPLSRVRLPRMLHITDKTVKTMAYHCPFLEFVRFAGRARISPDTIKMLRDNCIKRVYIAYHPRLEEWSTT
ncbi:uncharacterized protein [Ptychodera flava]|uniref:uncharacterized protein n=1 Tax=Ptychodera flava TaxID=63121 RepID=UPI00396A13DE